MKSDTRFIRRILYDNWNARVYLRTFISISLLQFIDSEDYLNKRAKKDKREILDFIYNY